MIQRKKRNISTILLVSAGCLLFSIPALAQYASPSSKLTQFFLQEYQKYGVPVVNQSAAQILPLERADPRADKTETNLGYRLEKIPTTYQNYREYLLIRKYGLLIPIINPTAEDRQAIDRGEVVPTEHYLARGAFWHYGKKPHQGNGNFVLAAHSSDQLSAPGAFKTAFAPLLVTNPGDTVDYYVKEGESFVRYEYNIFKAEVTDPYDTAILDQPTDKAMLTAYGCWPLGSTKERRYVQASLVKTEKAEIKKPVVDEIIVQEIIPQEKDTPEKPEQIIEEPQGEELPTQLEKKHEAKEEVQELNIAAREKPEPKIIERKSENIAFQTQTHKSPTKNNMEKEIIKTPTIKKERQTISIYVVQEDEPVSMRDKAVSYINIRKKIATIFRHVI